MREKKVLERLRNYEEYILRLKKEREKREKEESSQSVIAMIHAHEQSLGTGEECLR